MVQGSLRHGVLYMYGMELRHRTDLAARLHLDKDLVEPFQRSVYLDLNPAWGRSYIPTMVICAPPLHE